MCDKYSKTCECEDVPVIYDMTLLTTNATYYGIDETDVNATLTSLDTWDSEAIKLLCKSKINCTSKHLSLSFPYEKRPVSKRYTQFL